MSSAITGSNISKAARQGTEIKSYKQAFDSALPRMFSGTSPKKIVDGRPIDPDAPFLDIEQESVERENKVSFEPNHEVEQRDIGGEYLSSEKSTPFGDRPRPTPLVQLTDSGSIPSQLTEFSPHSLDGTIEPVEIRGRTSPSITKTQNDRPGPKGYISNYASRSPSTPIEQLIPNPDEAGHVGAYAELPPSLERPMEQEFEVSQVGRRFDEAFRDERRQTRVRRELADPSLGEILNEATSSINVFSGRGRSAGAGFVFREDTNAADSIPHLDRQSFTSSLAPRKPRQEPVRIKKKVNAGYSDHDPKLAESPFDATKVIEGDQVWYPGNQTTSPDGQIPKPADISLIAPPELVQRNVQTITQDITTKGYSDDLTAEDLRMPDGSLAKAIVRIPVPVMSQSSAEVTSPTEIDKTANLGYAGRADSKFVQTANDSLGYDQWEGSLFMSSALRDTDEFDNTLGSGDKVTGVAGTGFLYYSPTRKAWVEKRADSATSLCENTLLDEHSGSVNALEVNTGEYVSSDDVIPPQYMSEGVYDPGEMSGLFGHIQGSITIPTPAGIEEGDLLICFITARANSSNRTINENADWTTVERVNTAATGETIVYVAYRIATSSEPAYSWTFPGVGLVRVSPVGRVIRVAKGTFSPTNPIAYVDTKRKFEVDGSSPSSTDWMDRETLKGNTFSLPFKALRLSITSYAKTNGPDSVDYMSNVTCNLGAQRLGDIFISNSGQRTGIAQFARYTELDDNKNVSSEQILFDAEPPASVVDATSLATVDIVVNPNITNANQPILAIDPQGDGGFEDGSTFEENGWTVLNGNQNNIWYVGAPGTFEGSQGAYISGELNGGAGATAEFDYYNSSTDESYAYFYKDIQVPANAIVGCLRLKVKSGGHYPDGGNPSRTGEFGELAKVIIANENFTLSPGVPAVDAFLTAPGSISVASLGQTFEQFVTRSKLFAINPGEIIRVIFGSFVRFSSSNRFSIQPSVLIDNIQLDFYNSLNIASFPANEQLSIINNLPFESKQIASLLRGGSFKIIDPEKEGSFALGDGSFAANGWTVKNGFEENQWYVTDDFEGNSFSAAYISNDGGVTNQYDTSAASIVYLYREVNLRSTIGFLNISFDVRVEGEGGTPNARDYVTAGFTPLTSTIDAGTLIPLVELTQLSQIHKQGPDDFVTLEAKLSISGFVRFFGSGFINSYFIIQWRNDDNDSGDQPPAAITNINISLEYDETHYITPLQVTGSNEILAQFSASPQLGYLLPYKEHLERIGYDAIGTPTVTYGAPFAPKYHGFQDETIKMSDYIDRPFRVKKVIIKAPVEVQRRHDIEDTGYTLEYPGQDWTRNVTARKDLDNYTFFLYRQRRIGEQIARADTIEDRETSSRYLIASASVCVYNSSSFGLSENDGFMEQLGAGTPVLSGTLADNLEPRFFEGDALAEYVDSILHVDPAGDGGFEDGTSDLVGGDGTFAVNGWTFVNGTETNQWYVGPVVSNGGLRGAYISDDGGITNGYSADATWVHFYRDIEVGADIESLLINFDIRVQGQVFFVDRDFARLSIGSTSTAVNAGSAPSGGGVATVSNYRMLGTNFVNISEDVLVSGPGVIRIIFSWRNDPFIGIQPPASIDNIEIIEKSPVLSTSRIAPQILETSSAVNDSFVGSITIDKPAGTEEGDLLVAIISGRCQSSAETNVNVPAGWALVISSGESTTRRVCAAVLYRIAEASEPSDYTFTTTSNIRPAARILRITGYDPTDPVIPAFPGVTEILGSDTITQPSVPTNAQDYPQLLIQTYAASFGGSASAISVRETDLGINRLNDLISYPGGSSSSSIQHVRYIELEPGTSRPSSIITVTPDDDITQAKNLMVLVNPAQDGDWEAECPHQLTIDLPENATILKTEASWTYGQETGNTSEQASFLRAVGGNDSQVYFGDSPIQNTPTVMDEEVFGDPLENVFTSTVSIDVPADTSPGDLVIAIINGRIAGHSTASEIIPLQSGWTIVHSSFTNPSESISSAMFVAYRTDASVGGSYSFGRSTGGSFRYVGRLIRVIGHNASDPIADLQFDFDDSGSEDEISSLPISTPPYNCLRLTALSWNAGNATSITCDLGDTSSEEIRLSDAINTSTVAGTIQAVRHMRFRGNMSELYTFSSNGRLYALDILINPEDSDNLTGDRTYNLLSADENIANSITGSSVTYELHPARTFIGDGCTTSANFIKEWSVKAYYMAPLPNTIYLDGLVTHITGNLHDPLLRRRLTRVSEPLHSPAVAINAGLDDYSESCRFFGKGKLSFAMYPAIVEGGFPVPTLMYITSSTAHYSTSFYRPTIPGSEENPVIGTNRLFNRYPVTGSFFDLNAQFDEFGDLRPEIEVPRPPITSIVQNFWFGGNRQPSFNTDAHPLTNFEGIEDRVEVGPYVRFRPDDPFFKTAQSAQFIDSFTNPTYDIELGRVGLSVFDAITDPFNTQFALVSDPRGKPFALSANPKGRPAGVFKRSNLINFAAAASETEPGFEQDAVLTIGSLSGSSFAELAASLTLGYAPSTPGSSRQELIGYVLRPEDELIFGLDAGVTPPPDIAPLAGVPLPDRQGPDIEIFEFSRRTSELIDVIDVEAEVVEGTVARRPPGADRILNEPPPPLINTSRTEGGSLLVIQEERVKRNDVLKPGQKIEASDSAKQKKSEGYTNKKGGF